MTQRPPSLYDRRDELRKFEDSLRAFGSWLESNENMEACAMDSVHERLAAIRALISQRSAHMDVVASIDRAISKIRAIRGRRRA